MAKRYCMTKGHPANFLWSKAKYIDLIVHLLTLSRYFRLRSFLFLRALKDKFDTFPRLRTLKILEIEHKIFKRLLNIKVCHLNSSSWLRSKTLYVLWALTIN